MFPNQWECLKLRCNMAEVGVNMAGVDIKIDEAELKNIYKQLKKYPKKAERAIIRTKNDTAQRTLSPLKKMISSNYNIAQNKLMGGSEYAGESSNNLIKVIKTNTVNQNSAIKIRGSYLTLHRFVRGNKQPRNKKGKGYVSVQVRKGGTRKMGRTTFIQHDPKSNHPQVFQRYGNSRKIRRLLKTISVAHMASNKDIQPKVQDAAMDIMKKRAEHYINRELAKN